MNFICKITDPLSAVHRLASMPRSLEPPPAGLCGDFPPSERRFLLPSVCVNPVGPPRSMFYSGLQTLYSPPPPPRECFRGQINNTVWFSSTPHWCKGGRSKRIQRMMKASKTESWEHEYQREGHFHPAPLRAVGFPSLDTSLKLLQLCHVEECADK